MPYFPSAHERQCEALKFMDPIPSTHDASSLGQLKHGLEIVHVSGLNFKCQLARASCRFATCFASAAWSTRELVNDMNCSAP